MCVALGLDDLVRGSLWQAQCGFDELLMDSGVPGGRFDVLQLAATAEKQPLVLLQLAAAAEKQPLVLQEQCLNDGDGRNIAAVYVQRLRCV